MPSFPRQKKPKSHGGQASSTLVKPDPRFAALGTDPRYRLPSKKNTHIQLDKRFGRILTDKNFVGHGGKRAAVDRYGRKVEKSDASKSLKRFYRLEDEHAEEDEDDEGENDEFVKKELLRAKKYDPARDGGFSSSESDSESDSDSDESIHLGKSELAGLNSENIEAELPEESAEVPTGDVTTRLAVVNLDWDNVHAQDIFAVARSFLPSDGGSIISVTVYPSEFGRERMEREEIEGPPREIFQSSTKSKSVKSELPLDDLEPGLEDEEDEDSEAEEERIKHELTKEEDAVDFDSNALRKYQLERLRYYYAVIFCSSKSVAKTLYDAMDGQEYLSSANFFDLRFVPDDVDFESDKPRDVCTEVSDGYKPEEFTTDALMHSNVKLTWDVEDNKRKEVQKRAFSRKEMEEEDLKAYIASASSSEEEEEEFGNDEEVDIESTTSRATTKQSRADTLRAAISDFLEVGEKERNVGGVQVTFTPALSLKSGVGKVIEDREETTAEKYVRKERERKARRREQAKARRNGEQIPEINDEEENTMQNIEDAGFDDPFFDDATKFKSKKRDRKSKVRFNLDEDEEASRAKAELELIMAPDTSSTANATGKHFDMRAMVKAEKEAQKRQKKKSKKQKKIDVDDILDESAVNLQDPRFASLYTDPAFAIDPTDHKFRETKGMRAILDEKRRRTEEAMKDRGGNRKRQSEAVGREMGDLIESVRKKVKG